MIALFLMAIPIVSISGWLYLKFAPAHISFRRRAAFEGSVLVFELMGCGLVHYYSYATMGQGPDRAWWPVLAVIYCLFLIPLGLILAALLRRFLYRKRLK